MRVLMTLDAVGGVWRYAMELARAARPRGVDFVLVGLGPEPSGSQAEEARALGELVWLDGPLDWMAASGEAFDDAAPALERVADERDVQLMHLNLPSLAAGLSRRRPVVVVSHSCVVSWWKTMRDSPLPEEWAWQRDRNAAGLARADVVVAPSMAHAQLIHRCYPGMRPATVVANATGIEIKPAMRREPFVFAAGRWWDEGKGGAVLEAAAPRIDWPVLMAGAATGPSGQGAALGHARSLGEIGHDAVLDHASRAAIVASPSLYEPFGLAALEGARCGAALVLSDIPTYRELWDDAAIFFPRGDAAGLADALRWLAEDDRLRDDMAARARARSERFTPGRQALRMVSLYQTALARSHPSPVEA